MRKFLSFIVSLTVLLSLNSCDNSLTYEPNPNDSIQVQLVREPDVTAYSGGKVLGNTFATRAGSTLTKWQSDTKIEGWPETTDRNQAVSQAEYNYVMDYLSKHPDEGYTECELTTYFLQLVGKSHVTYHEPFIDDKGDVHHYADIDGSEQMDYFELNGVHINDYNGDAGPWIYAENLPLVNPRYHESYNNLTQENHYRFYYIQYNGEWGLYLCFDYATSKYDNGQLDFDGDGVYNDWVIKIIPAEGTVTPPGVTPDEPEDTPEHVEVNLSIDRKDGVEWLASHLSIHVRANTDVEVFIPVPVRYVCEADDLAIVQKHEEDLMIHGGPTEVVYNIGNRFEVTLTVSVASDGITVRTSGIQDSGVIDYLQETYGDGLTFEVWNYFNIKHNSWYEGDDEDLPIEPEALRDILNGSTVKFITNTPDLYVNAFNDTENGSKFVDDCVVGIVNEQSSLYNEPEEGPWYNGSVYNNLYKKL